MGSSGKASIMNERSQGRIDELIGILVTGKRAITKPELRRMRAEQRS